jgi:hypothetical protein
MQRGYLPAFDSGRRDDCLGAGDEIALLISPPGFDKQKADVNFLRNCCM